MSDHSPGLRQIAKQVSAALMAVRKKILSGEMLVESTTVLSEVGDVISMDAVGVTHFTPGRITVNIVLVKAERQRKKNAAQK